MRRRKAHTLQGRPCQHRVLNPASGQTNTLRSMLREYYPAALGAFEELAGRDALAVLAAAPTPADGRRLSVKAQFSPTWPRPQGGC